MLGVGYMGLEDDSLEQTMKISKRQRHKNSKILEYLREDLSRKEIVIGSKNKWRIFTTPYGKGWLRVRYYHWKIHTSYQREIPRLLPKPKKTNYIIWPLLGRIASTIVKIIQTCPKYSPKEDVTFSTLLFLRILSDNKVKYFEVKYYV